MSASQIFAGLALIVGLAVSCQVIAAQLRITAIILLLPVGFAAGALTTVVNPDKIFGAAFSPLVSLAVALILFDGGLDLESKGLRGDSRLVVRRLRGFGIPLTWAGAGFLVGPAARPVVEGSGNARRDPDRVWPDRGDSHPGRRPAQDEADHDPRTRRHDLDPIGAIIAVVVFNELNSGHAHHWLAGTSAFAARIGIGVAGVAVGILVLWLLLKKLKLTGILATQAIIATVITVAGLCDAIRDDTGLVAAIIMGSSPRTCAESTCQRSARSSRRSSSSPSGCCSSRSQPP